MRGTLRLLAGAVLLLAACGGSSKPAPQAASSSPLPRSESAGTTADDRLVAVDGHDIHVVCQGSGSPAVLVELGVGQSTSQWKATQPELAKTSRTCVYERAGTGKSQVGPQPRTAEQVSTELAALITAADIPTPLIIVSHSLGGMYTQLFAVQHKDLIAGLVFIEPRTAEYQLGYKENLTPSERADDAALDAQAIASETFGPEIAGSDASAQQVAAAGPLPDVPVIVLTAGIPFPNQSAADRAFWVLTHQHLAKQAGGEARVVDGAEHEIWITHSDVVVAAVAEVTAKS